MLNGFFDFAIASSGLGLFDFVNGFLESFDRAYLGGFTSIFTEEMDYLNDCQNRLHDCARKRDLIICTHVDYPSEGSEFIGLLKNVQHDMFPS